MTDEERVGRILGALSTANLTRQAAAVMIGISIDTFMRRMKDPSTWTIGELESLAAACGKEKTYFLI